MRPNHSSSNASWVSRVGIETGTGTGTADKLKARLLPLLPPGAESGIAVQRGAVVPPALEQLARL